MASISRLQQSGVLPCLPSNKSSVYDSPVAPLRCSCSPRPRSDMGRPRFTQPASAALLAVLISAVALVCAAQEAPAGPTPVEDGSLPTAEPHTARTVCNPATLNSTRPIPCTEDQEADALADLAADTPSAADAAAAVFDTSTCDPADAGNYTEAVELFEADLLAVVYDVAHEFVLAQPNDSFWALNCTGDYTQDPFNACRVPAEANAPQVSGRAGLMNCKEASMLQSARYVHSIFSHRTA